MATALPLAPIMARFACGISLMAPLYILVRATRIGYDLWLSAQRAILWSVAVMIRRCVYGRLRLVRHSQFCKDTLIASTPLSSAQMDNSLPAVGKIKQC